MDGEITVINIPDRFEGPSGQGQGGWAAAKFAAATGERVTVALRAPLPLNTNLTVMASNDGWLLVDPTPDEPVPILEASRWDGHHASTEPVSPAEAEEARTRFLWSNENHPAPRCFSCGLAPDSMCVHAGPLGDGRFATDWTVPEWAAAADGSVETGVLWAALDCTAAWYVSGEPPARMAFTVQYAVDVLQPLELGATYAIVGWEGDHPAGWDGRKRGAASAAFDRHGECVARARSFWVSAA